MGARRVTATLTSLEEFAQARVEAGERYFGAEAERIARLCHRAAERFARGGRLLALGRSPAARSDARHVAVEFVHPVIVGKRALPALALCAEGGPLPAQVALIAEPDDLVIAFEADDAETGEALALAVERGCLPIAFDPPGDPFVRQELVETGYHVLWELVHVFFEHRGLLEGRRAAAVHDTGASAFLYPFLGEQEDDLEAVVADVRDSVLAKAAETAALRVATLTGNADALVAGAAALRAAFGSGGRLLALGNGGSATDAMDVVADLHAAGHAALDLTEDAAILTAIANDIGAEAMFARQVIAHARPGDVLLALSTSGTSASVIAALAEARRRGAATIALVGYDGGQRGRRWARRPRRGQPLRAHPADPGGAGDGLPRPVRARGGAVSLRARARVEGTVQGVGFRPYVYRLARDERLGGWVRNDERGVVLEVEGAPDAVERFLARLPREAPPLAAVEDVRSCTLGCLGERDFLIVESARRGAADAPVAADSATCDACLAELRDPADRRYRYPFVNCTDCGPRFTIVRGVPYDRARTTMAGFAMCAACRAEYEDPLDRRFHAEPNACPACGPRARLLDADGVEVAADAARGGADGVEVAGDAARRGAGDAVAAAAAALRGGAIVAVKGIGGYHLACRADDEAAVASCAPASGARTGRSRSWRPASTARGELVALTRAETARLCGRDRPIVIAPARRGARVAAAVAPGVRELGVMLPYSPLHHLLLADAGTPLVMTSGNVSDEPIAYRDADALERLAGLADRFLVHDRPIETRTDDTVVRGPLVLRRSRGRVPGSLPLPVPAERPVLACGAELKSTFCLARGGRAWVGHHIGDLQNWETLASYREGIAHFERLFAVAPEVVAHDLHPDYRSTAYALDRDAAEHVAVQHHHAHLAACLAEHGETGPAVGAIFDGSGLGTDGTVWGGELLAGGLDGFVRAGHLWPVRLPGGDAAVREPWRMACAWLAAAEVEPPPALARRIDPARWAAVAALVRSGTAAPETTSAGRLFDAVAALCGLRDAVTYEGQAAVELEAACDPEERGAYPLPVVERGTADTALVLDARATIAAVAADVRAGAAPGAIAARFHRALAGATATAATLVAERRGLGTVVLSGGVFQNRVLLDGDRGAARARRAARARAGAPARQRRRHRVRPGRRGRRRYERIGRCSDWMT